MCCFKKVAPPLEPQSGTTSDSNIFKAASQSTNENVQFSDQHDPYMYEIESSMDSTRALNDTNDTSLENFFARPVKISEQEWSTSTSLAYSLDPWSLFFDNPRVANRLNNYNLLKATLKVKIVINGNGFQYGRMLVSYLPMDTYDGLSSNAALIREDLVQASQLPHIFLNPTLSTGGELKLPMFNYRNYMNVVQAQWEEMGRLDFRTLNNLKHANGATDVVTITTFAWAEDVSMSVLTSVDQDTLTPQSGVTETEIANQTGVVSGPATSIAKFAAYLKGVPYIGPFALATEIGANAVAGMAKIFGYSRPIITKAPEPYKPTYISSLALTNTPDVVQKVTVDDKQELTIDPRITGIGPSDSMNIREIAKRESYLTTFNWAIGTAPDSLLFNARLDPCTFATSVGASTAFHFPACAMAALPFQYWKGSMKFRFQIVCSSFHKGRLKFVYDPNFIADNTYLGFSEYNTNYLKIVDIAEEQDFTIEIGGAQDINFLEHVNPGQQSSTEVYSTSRYTSRDKGNGVIGVIVVNELTTPSSIVTNDVEINVFVSMGDDFEVAAPDDYFQRFVLKPQSGVVADAMGEGEVDAPQQSESCIIGLPPNDDPNLNKVFFGESIVTFRTMLKRYTLWNSVPCTSNFPSTISGRFPQFPYLRGNVSGAVDETTAGEDYNYCNTLLLHWVSCAFSGRRGSIRYKFIAEGPQFLGDKVTIQRSPYVRTAPAYEFDRITRPTFSSVTQGRKDIMSEWAGGTGNNLPASGKPFSGARGVALTTNSVNGSLEFEIPYYSPYRFTPGKPVNYTTSQVFDTAWDYKVDFEGDGRATMHVYAAAGEDFQTYFFTGLPRMYYESSPPA